MKIGTGATTPSCGAFCVVRKAFSKMDDTELCQLLDQLHQEIGQIKSIGEKERALLKGLDADIRDLLERNETKPLETHPLIIQRLEDAVDALAVNHPTLTAILSNMLTTLSNAGV